MMINSIGFGGFGTWGLSSCFSPAAPAFGGFGVTSGQLLDSINDFSEALVDAGMDAGFVGGRLFLWG